MDKLDYLIVPLTERDRVKLGMRDEFYEEDGTIGMMFVPSRVRESINRWKKYGSPCPFESGEVADAVATLNNIVEGMQTRHRQEIGVIEGKHSRDLQEAREKAILEGKEIASADAEQIHRERELDQKRIELRKENERKLKGEIIALEERVSTYHRDYGDAREHPLNWLQKTVIRLFRIRN